MKTKTCALCKMENEVMFRIQIETGKSWIFVCESCCKTAKSLSNYRYGGTWKGKRH